MRRQPYILLCVVAVVAVLPLFVGGYSCGHDFDFHVQSWMEAKRQILHGTLRPHWVFSAAWGAGEPRFVFYPPLSWTLGALLACVTPIAQLPAVYTLVVVTLAAWTMFRFAQRHVSQQAALVAAALYAVNPYLLFTAYERTAFAELLAAAWMPLLLAAVLEPELSVPPIAAPIALLWLTNAPAAVVGCYAFAMVLLIRLVMTWKRGTFPWRLLSRGCGGVGLGTALAAFYLLPAALERKLVQINLAVLPNMRVEDNFLFGHTGDAPHDTVLRQASVIALCVLLPALALLMLTWRRRSKDQALPLQGISLLLIACMLFLLTPLSGLLWRYLPELAFLQFPWRFLCAGAVLLAFAAALAIDGTTFSRMTGLAFVCMIALCGTLVGPKLFRQGCETQEQPASIASAIHDHVSLPPTDEYTPVGADNDALRRGSLTFWLSHSPTGFSPRASPNPPDSDASGFADAVPFSGSEPFDSDPVEEDFEIPSVPYDGYLILNLRAYPNWKITVTDPTGHETRPQPVPRADGLIAIPLEGMGRFRVRIAWKRSRDELAGIGLSLAAAATCGLLLWRGRSRRINT